MENSSGTVADPLLTAAQVGPDKVAVVDDRPGSPPRSLTYQDYNRCVNRLANGLINLGAGPGEHVMWLGQNSLEVTAIVHAARKAGLVSVPLNYRLTDDEALFVINDSDSVIIYADAAFAEMLERLRPRMEQVRQVVIFARPGEADDAGRSTGLRPGQLAEVDILGSADEPAPRTATDSSDDSSDDEGSGGLVMIYTSGTTGNPKGAVRSATGGSDQRIAMLQFVGYRPDDVYITCGPLYHSGPGGFAAVAFALGQTVVRRRRLAAAHRHLSVLVNLLSPDPGSHGAQSAGGDQGPLRPLVHANHAGQRRPLAVPAQGGLR